MIDFLKTFAIANGIAVLILMIVYTLGCFITWSIMPINMEDHSTYVVIRVVEVGLFLVSLLNPFGEI
jgi:hypothetical protein